MVAIPPVHKAQAKQLRPEKGQPLLERLGYERVNGGLLIHGGSFISHGEVKKRAYAKTLSDGDPICPLCVFGSWVMPFATEEMTRQCNRCDYREEE